jgi:hypothetical protein
VLAREERREVSARFELIRTDRLALELIQFVQTCGDRGQTVFWGHAFLPSVENKPPKAPERQESITDAIVL